jgi:hypothetical protein
MTPQPRQGDVIVARRDDSGRHRYDVGPFQGPRQYTVDTYELALNRADSFAREALVDVWYTEDLAGFRLITSRRAN